MSEPFNDLGDAISDQRFVDVDLALRRGQHIDHDDADWYAYLLDGQAVLEPFYRRYGCELIHRSDGYFFLLPTGDKVAKRLLGVPEMIVGQGAALLYLDPSTIESGGVVSKEDLLSHLAAVMGTDTLVAVFNPKRKRMDERVAQETVRQRVGEGLRKLTQLGFVTVSDDHRIRLRSALMRFADPVRGAGSPREALEKLIARGEVSIPTDPPGENDEEVTDAEGMLSDVELRRDELPNAPGLTSPRQDEDEDDTATQDEDWAEPRADANDAHGDEYVFDAENQEEDEGDRGAESKAGVGAALPREEDESFGIDFDDPATGKRNLYEAKAPGDTPSTARIPSIKSPKQNRKTRKRESLQPLVEDDPTAPSPDKELGFDEFD